MEVEGKIIFDLGERSGTSRAGNPWKTHEYVLETRENFPRKIAFDFFGDKADQFVCKVGDEIRLFFDIESREYNGRWFVSVRGWKTEPLTGAPAQQAGDPLPPPVVPDDKDDNLPF